MNRLFDNLSQQLAEMLKTGKFDNIVKLADGGAVMTGAAGGNDLGNTIGNAIGSIFSGGSDNTDNTSNGGISGALGNALSGVGKSSTNSYSDNALGTRFYMSPPYIARQYSELGKFFSGTEPGNFYTNRYKEPMQHQPQQSTRATDFYNQWYERMRNFAEAEEVATRGQPQVRSTGGGR